MTVAVCCCCCCLFFSSPILSCSLLLILHIHFLYTDRFIALIAVLLYIIMTQQTYGRIISDACLISLFCSLISRRYRRLIAYYSFAYKAKIACRAWVIKTLEHRLLVYYKLQELYIIIIIIQVASYIYIS